MPKLIASFSVDHSNLQPGIYRSRTDEFDGVLITTWDIRMTTPNHEPAMAPAAIHTIEHIIATYLRNDDEWKDRIVYWGPMGCLTGMYLIVRGDYEPEVMRGLMLRAYRHLADYEGVVPGAEAASCGNYLMHDLPMARWEAERYVGRLTDAFHSEYPGLVRPKAEDGSTFFDA